MRYLSVLSAVILSLGIVRTACADPEIRRDPSSGRVGFVAADDSGSVTSIISRDPRVAADAFVDRHGALFGAVAGAGSLRDATVDTDADGISHVKYHQYLHGIPVFGSQIIVHINSADGKQEAGGKIAEIAPAMPATTLSAGEAEAAAIAQWGLDFTGNPQIRGDSELTWLDSGLVGRTVSEAPRLTWKVGVGANVPPRSYHYFVDAETGVTLLKISRHHQISRRIYDCSHPAQTCYLDFLDSMYPYTFGRSEGQPERGASPIFSSYRFETDNIYSYLGSTNAYFFDRHARNSANGVGGLGSPGGQYQNVVDAFTYGDSVDSSSQDNAYYSSDGDYMSFGRGVSTLDVAGHEFTHAVTNFTSNLIYMSESGALNESFSDIFGEAIENYANGSNDWLLGVGSSLGAIRNMADPTTMPLSGQPYFYPQPDKFYSQYTACGTGDNGGVHQNSGVMNHAAYLMAEGGTFNGCTIQPIGREKEEKLFYAVLTNYLTSSANFSDAYNGLLSRCEATLTMEECMEVRKALLAVEMDQPSPCLGGAEAIPDCSTVVDECPDAPNAIKDEGCGCGVPVSDSDVDGTPNCHDGCPTDPLKIAEGSCGCGVSDADTNGNSVADCFDPAIRGVTPAAPKVTLGKGSVKISVTKFTGVSYVITVATSTPGRKRSVKTISSTTGTATVKKLPVGATVEVSYTYVLPGSPSWTSNASKKKKVKIK